MSYVDALFDRERDRIHIVERVNGERRYTDYPAQYIFYYDDAKGKFKTIYDTPVSRFSTRNNKEFRKELAMRKGKTTWESDINPVFRCLAENYMGKDVPKLHVAFFDIETDFDPEKGFSTPEDPFTKITAITVYLQWLDKLVTLALPPKAMSIESANEIGAKFDNTFMFEEETDMMKTFLDLIEDADVLSGWNSEGYDIPYCINRTARILSKDDTRRFCLWQQMPKGREYEKFGALRQTFDLVGRIHVDYMNLYRKYTYEERHSYSLDAIGDYELGERKVIYEGSLDALYNKDFEKFIAYNRQDVALLGKLDSKLKFMDLSNVLAHENTVLIQTTMGAVALTEQAIINEAHSLGLVVPDRKRHDGDTQAAGAYVAYPKVGLHEWIGAIDINSLYPSAIRALNMAPESIVGQLRPIMTDQYINNKIEKEKCSFAEAWEGLFGSLEYTSVMEQKRGVEITVDWADGTEDVLTGHEVYNMIFKSDQPWILSANGTIFSYERKGVVPGLLERWYAERKIMQAKLKEAIESKDAEKIEFWDKRQLVKKINLNSLYGAILNPGCRFFDKRIGQSTTLTGRSIAKHMDSYVNECITGKYDHIGAAIIYGDTDSVYFSAWPIIKDDVEAGRMEWNKEICVQLYDSIAEQVNQSFPAFMEQAFHCPRELGAIIKGGRELVASRGLYITKKRYAVLIFDKENKRLDVDGKPGKVKAMGLDLKRSDTPKVVQDFLSKILMDVLCGAQEQEILTKIVTFREEFITRPAWEKGTPKRVNKLTYYGDMEKKHGKFNMPGHVRAAINWNTLKRMFSDNYSQKITDGQKIIVCKLKDNPIGYTSVAYPVDENHLPEWFLTLPFDHNAMESTIVDGKVENLLGVLNWNLSSTVGNNNSFNQMFG
jgi:DNA polymerase elongation subunit (family B)